MTSFNGQVAAGDQFSFSSNSLAGVESGDDYGLAFGWHSDTYGCCEPEWLARDPSSYGRQLSPTSRVQEIAKYKQEMLDLVQELPEYAYELSLRDLVELPRIARTQRDSPTSERAQKNKMKNGGKEKVKKIGRSSHSRIESMESAGFLLKMFFPIPSPVKKRSSVSASRSSASGSSSSSGSSGLTGTKKSGSGSRVEPKPSKGGPDKNSQVKSVEMQHGALSRNSSRYNEELRKYFVK